MNLPTELLVITLAALLQVVQYVLSHLIRRNSRVVRLTVGVARGLVALGLFRHLVPYRYLLFGKPDRDPESGHT